MNCFHTVNERLHMPGKYRTRNDPKIPDVIRISAAMTLRREYQEEL